MHNYLGDSRALSVVGQRVLQSKGIGKFAYSSVSDTGTLINGIASAVLVTRFDLKAFHTLSECDLFSQNDMA